jgi:AcrR family transcriptional regulator
MTRGDEEHERGRPQRGQPPHWPQDGGRLHVGPVWDRPQRRKRAQPTALTREQIVRAAIEIADADGLEAISMRRIAQRLGAGAMSLYWHVASKEELLSLVYDEIFGEIEPLAPRTGDWRADAERMAHATRAVMLRHPWMVSVVGNQPALGPNLLQHIESSLAVLEPLELDPAFALSIMSTIDNAVTGFVVQELQHRAYFEGQNLTEEELFASLEPYLRQQLATGRYPLFERSLDSLLATMNEAEKFQFGLDCLLDGIALRIDAARTGSA